VLTMVRNELLRLGYSEEEIEGGGLRVTTTFTKKAMDAAVQGVVEARPDGFSDKQLHIGVASVEPGTGALRGIFGGQDFLDSQINWAVAGGQAGSTMKAAALVAAIEDGFTLEDTFEGNSPLVLPDGTDFENQGDQDYGSAVSMVTAAENSINTAFIDMTMSMEDGPQKVVEAANALGIPPAQRESRRAPGFPNATPGLEPNTGVSLGSATVSPVNMANAYATLANGGRAAEPYLIEKVELASGETDYQHKVANEQNLTDGIAADVTFALQQVGASESAESALGRPVAGKTGTATNGDGEVSSAWYAGYTPQLSTAVMYVRGKGNEQLQGWLPSYFGSDFPAATWTAVMQRAMEGMEIEEFPEPEYVDLDGEEEEGHEPFTPEPTTQAPPPTTQAPPTTQQPSQEPTTQEPTQEPTTEEPTPTEEPTTPGPTGCPPLQNCETTSPPPSDGGTSGGATGAPAAFASPFAGASAETVRERYSA
jgi:membrane peptidoglycan carboxypeptidase